MLILCLCADDSHGQIRPLCMTYHEHLEGISLHLAQTLFKNGGGLNVAVKGQGHCDITKSFTIVSLIIV